MKPISTMCNGNALLVKRLGYIPSNKIGGYHIRRDTLNTKGDNMDMITELSNLFNNIAFPFSMCAIMCFYIWQRDKKDSVKDDLHKKEVDKLAEAIENNTKIMERVLEALERK